MRIALLKAIACWDIDKPKVPEKLKTLHFGWGKFEQKHAVRVAYLAMALYFFYCRGFSKGRAASLAEIPLGDIDYALGLVKRTKISVAQLCHDLESNIPLKSAVDAYFEDLVVSLDERALEDMLLAAVESYLARTGKKGEKYKECYGWCLGYETRSPPKGLNKRVETTLRVTRVVTQIRASAGANFVMPNDGSARAHRRVAARFFPHLQLIGDYHTHPYKTAQFLTKKKGWEYSSADSEHIADWVEDVRKDGGNPRFSFVVAVAEGGKSGVQMKRLAPNRWKIGVSNLHLVIAAYRILHDRSYDNELKLKLSYLGGGES